MQQSLIRFFVSVCLLFGLVLVGCKKLEEPQPEPQNTPLENIKRWYAQKTQPKQTHKSLQNSVWYPQWEASYTVRLDEQTRLVTFPVWRYKAVTYYDIGFVRRLAFRINNQDEVIDGKMLHMVGHKTYLKQFKNDLSRRYYTEGRQALMPQAMIREYEITALDIRNDKNGDCETTEETYLFDQDNCVVHYSSNCGKPIDFTVMDCIQTVLFPVWDGGSGGGTSPGNGIPIDTGVGGGGDGSGSVGYPIYSEDPSCDTCPADGLDSGDNTDPDQELPGITLDATMDDPINKKIRCVYDELIKMPQIKNLLKGYGTSAGFTLNIKVFDLPDEGDLGQTTTLNNSYPPDFSRVEIRLDPALLQEDKPAIEVALTIIHEFLHARMYAKIANGGGVNNIPISVPNFYAELQKYGFGSPADYKYNEAGHEYMAKWEIDELASLVGLYDGATTPSLGHKMMVWQGLYDTYRYIYDAFPNSDSRTAQDNYAKNFKNSKLNEPACK